MERWLAEPGNEEEQSRSFWIQLLEEVLGIPNATHVLQFERKVKGRKIDVLYEDMGKAQALRDKVLFIDAQSYHTAIDTTHNDITDITYRVRCQNSTTQQPGEGR